MTHSYTWHDSFIHVTWLIHVRSVWLMVTCVGVCGCHDSFIHVTRLIHTRDMTHSHMWHDPFMWGCWITHSFMWGEWIITHEDWHEHMKTPDMNLLITYIVHVRRVNHYITLHDITLHYITLHYITLHYITLHYITYIYTSHDLIWIIKISLMKAIRKWVTNSTHVWQWVTNSTVVGDWRRFMSGVFITHLHAFSPLQLWSSWLIVRHVWSSWLIF